LGSSMIVEFVVVMMLFEGEEEEVKMKKVMKS
jgi:hypothetical protein